MDIAVLLRMHCSSSVWLLLIDVERVLSHMPYSVHSNLRIREG